MKNIANSITELIGGTPLLKIKNANEIGHVYAKLEYFNPGGSVKDRIALAMIEQAESTGRLKPGYTIVEPTSGNTGIGLAMVGASKGYNVILIMPDTMSVERQKLMLAFGAEIILTPGAEGMKASIAKATELSEQETYFMPLQFNNPANPNIHEITTAREIVNDFENEKIDAFVAGVGTGGTLTGVGHILKETYPDIKIYAVEPEESEVLRGGNHRPHKIQGIGAGFVPNVLDGEVYDEIIPVSSEDAMSTAREVAQNDGALIGISAGAAIFAANKVAKELGKGSKVVTIVPDSGERYLTTALYEKNKTK